jgi:hypothetical protein
MVEAELISFVYNVGTLVGHSRKTYIFHAYGAASSPLQMKDVDLGTRTIQEPPYGLPIPAPDWLYGR